MLDFDAIKILFCLDPVDMRKSIDGLTTYLSDHFKMDPQSDYLFVFRNRSRNKIKMIRWDRNGFLLIYKRLEQGRFKIPRHVTQDRLLLDEQELSWLLSGIEFYNVQVLLPKKFQSYY